MYKLKVVNIKVPNKIKGKKKKTNTQTNFKKLFSTCITNGLQSMTMRLIR